VPTFADEGFAQPQFRLRDWLALAAPAGTPRPILQRMAELIKAGTDTPSVMRARDASGVTELPILLDDFEKALAEERPVWQNATRDLNLVLE
jgi:tripartite-type tricarboxylate transporter receptor subunit TctC